MFSIYMSILNLWTLQTQQRRMSSSKDSSSTIADTSSSTSAGDKKDDKVAPADADGVAFGKTEDALLAHFATK